MKPTDSLYNFLGEAPPARSLNLVGAFFVWNKKRAVDGVKIKLTN
jgi:hypothetical protein